MPVPNLLTPDDVASLLGVTTHTLAVWRSEKRYNLPYVKSGRLVRYKETDINEFIDQQTRQ